VSVAALKARKAFSNTVKSGPALSAIALSSKRSTIEPPKPSENTSRPPWKRPEPSGGPVTMPGR
jgi:hypothetical protein